MLKRVLPSRQFKPRLRLESTGISKINTIAAHPFGGVTSDAIGENLPSDLSKSTGASRSMKGFDSAPHLNIPQLTIHVCGGKLWLP
jgi:hypothetical protein